MMNSTTTLGVDRRGGSILVVRVEQDGGRPEVSLLKRLDDTDGLGSLIAPDERVVLSIPDHLVQTKILHLPNESLHDLADRCRFEMCTSLLEPESEFYFETIIASVHPSQIGLAYRCQVVNDLYAELGIPGVKHDSVAELPQSETQHVDNQQIGTQRVGVHRAVALGRGLLGFGQPVAGELLACADLSEGLFSVCLIYRREILSLGYLDLARSAQNIEQQPERLAAEFKTLINFKMAELAQTGLSLPLSRLVLSGVPIDSEQYTAIEKYFPSGLTPPELNRGFLASDLQTDDRDSEYLIALGLTVN